MQPGQRCSRNRIEGFAAGQVLATIPLQAARPAPLNEALTATMRAQAVGTGSFEQRVGPSINLLKKLIGKVFLEVSREVGQGLFEGVHIRSFHGVLHLTTIYTIVYTVLLERTNS